jgi:hypothetical protein
MSATVCTTSAGARGSAISPARAFCDLHPPLDGGQQQHAAVRRQPPAIKCRTQLLAPDGWQ